MLISKLFAALAGILAILASLRRGQLFPSMDLYFHSTYIVLSPYHWQLLGALVCTIFALTSLAVAQWMARPLNESMGVVSFTFIALAFIVSLIVGFFVRRDSSPSPWQIGALFGAILGFMFGCALFAVNVAWTLFRMIRVHSSPR
jgi:heme/copper-type cytochrome/quinol oxidase subunit 1